MGELAEVVGEHLVEDEEEGFELFCLAECGGRAVAMSAARATAIDGGQGFLEGGELAEID